MISLIVGILVMRTRSTRASATRRMPHRAKGDWGREKLGAASCCSFVRIFLSCLGGGLDCRETYYVQELSQHKHEIRLDDDIWGFGEVHGEEEEEQSMSLDEGL